ncbi:MAG: SGNH/GDSL hydrolase family protein [Chloroflexi bacterium]|nr:SGNH/GDSL hydrolase family protein [Chloroflexota bacterium]
MPPEVMANVRRIWAEGQALGRNPHAFSKLGDSVVATPAFLTPFGRPTHYHLGDYEALQPAIEQFGGSWLRYGVAIRPGLQARSVFDPFWADKEWCEPNETVLDCEIRLNNPAFLLIHLGANDDNSGFGRQLELIALRAIELGVVPILITKADRFEGEDDRNNTAIRQVAADHHLPLLDFDLLAGTIPLRGLRDDEVHLSAVPSGIYDYRDPATWETGQAIQNLAILFMFDALWEIVRSAE